MATQLFAPLPDATYPIIERISWLTDVQIAADGTEQRTALRVRPWFAYTWHTAFLPETFGDTPDATAALYAALARSQGASHPRVRIPLFAHAVAPNAEPTRGVASGSPVLSLSADGKEVAHGSPQAVMKVPTAEALLSVERSGEWVTDSFLTYRIDARTINHFESGSNPTALQPELLYSYAMEVLRHDWTRPVEESVRIDVDKRETWNAFSEAGRYEKRSLTLHVVAPDATAITALRSFLFLLRGRLREFAWTPPVPGLDGYYRLDQDVVEIAYTTQTFAETQLTLVKVS